MTTNHAYRRTRHIEHLATPGIAPGPPIPPRGRVNLTALIAALGFLVAIGLVLAAFVGIPIYILSH